MVRRAGHGVPAGLYTAPSAPGPDAVTAAAGPVTGSQAFTVVPPESGHAVRWLPGFASNTLPTGDDNSSGLVPFGFTADFVGRLYSGVYVNNKGNLTFDTSDPAFAPLAEAGGLAGLEKMIAPFWANVSTDPNAGGAGKVTYGADTVGGHAAFAATWDGVARAGASAGDPTDTFQAVLIDRSDITPGDLDVELNYNQLSWDNGAAAAGYSGGTAQTGTYAILPGSDTAGGLLDANPTTGLVHGSLGSDVPGRYVFQFRSGGAGLNGGPAVRRCRYC